ncbi:TMEM198/TM7SF3 family protein [Blautia schinkii]|nr:TMEM198/TM7SF3 family protein [Blautia schinkii]
MSDILTRIMNIAERIRGMQDLSMIAMGLFGVLLIFGIMNCLLGFRLLRFWMMLFGFLLGAGAGFALVYSSGTSEKYIYLAAMAALGIILAVTAFMIYKAGIFILGAGIGLALSIYLLHPTTSFIFFVCILVGVGIGTLAMRYAREVIIVGTSLLGGVLAGYSLARLGNMEEIPYGVGFSIGFAILGMLIQFATNKPRDNEDDEEDDYDDDDDADEYFSGKYEDYEKPYEKKYGKKYKESHSQEDDTEYGADYWDSPAEEHEPTQVYRRDVHTRKGK